MRKEGGRLSDCEVCGLKALLTDGCSLSLSYQPLPVSARRRAAEVPNGAPPLRSARRRAAFAPATAALPLPLLPRLQLHTMLPLAMCAVEPSVNDLMSRLGHNTLGSIYTGSNPRLWRSGCRSHCLFTAAKPPPQQQRASRRAARGARFLFRSSGWRVWPCGAAGAPCFLRATCISYSVAVAR